jgi:hypothetical protein
MTATLVGAFLREHLRAPTVLVMLAAIPVLFVLTAAAVMGPTAEANGIEIATPAATALGAAWSTAFLAGPLGFLQAVSSRGADRRLALAGAGALRVAAARMATSVVLAGVATAAALGALALRAGIGEVTGTIVGVAAFALIYVSIGTIIGSLVTDPIEGSLLIILAWLVDIFAAPALTGDAGVDVLPTRIPADVVMAAATGRGSPAGDYLITSLVAATALGLALTAFWRAARTLT